MIIRKYNSSDCPEMAELFYNTVHSVNAKDYSARQLNAWADGGMDLKELDKSFLEHFTVVAHNGGMITGFGDISHNGYLDRLFVHRDCQRQGIGSAICDALEKAAVSELITVHASITAKPFFEMRGYRLVSEQSVERKGIYLKNFVMEKNIRTAYCP